MIKSLTKSLKKTVSQLIANPQIKRVRNKYMKEVRALQYGYSFNKYKIEKQEKTQIL